MKLPLQIRLRAYLSTLGQSLRDQHQLLQRMLQAITNGLSPPFVLKGRAGPTPVYLFVLDKLGNANPGGLSEQTQKMRE